MNFFQYFSVSDFSACGQYLAVCTTDKKIHVWNVKNGKLEISVETKEAPVCSLAWQPNKLDTYELVYCNYEGYLGYVEYCPNDCDGLSSKVCTFFLCFKALQK